MSKFCPNCNQEMPDESNLCLNCMYSFCSDSYENRTKESESNFKKDRNFFTDLFTRIKALPKKKKIILITTTLCLVLLIFSLVYLLSPVETPVNTVQSDENITNSTGEAVTQRKITRAEKLMNKIIDKTQDDDATDTHKEGNNSAQNTLSSVESKNVSNNNLSLTSTSVTSSSGKKASSSSKNTGNNPSSTSGSSALNNSNNSTYNDNSSDNSSAGSYSPILNYNDWEYNIENGKLCITKYKGNDKHVMIPDQFESINVYRIKTNTFLDNSTVETVTFKDSEKYHVLWVEKNVFVNCLQLKKISFPNNTDLGIYSEFAIKCPKLNDIYVNHWQGKFADGAFYFKGDGKNWELIAYCEGCTNDTLNVPDWISSAHLASNNLSNCKYLKTINLPKGCIPPGPQNYDCKFKYLEEINIKEDDGTQGYFTYKGVLFARAQRDEYKTIMKVYPGSKKDKSFTFPPNCYIDFRFNQVNTYLETLYIPASSDLSNETIKNIKSYLPNIKTVNLQKGHTGFAAYQSALAWNCAVSQY